MSAPVSKAVFAVAVFALVGCEGPQSAFSGTAPESSRVIFLTWVMIIGGTIILAVVCGAIAAAISGPASWKRALRNERVILYGGIAFPVIVLTLLLFYGFVLLRAGDSLVSDENALRVAVVGEQWWWRVIYETRGGETFETANELRIPVGRTVAIELTSADVIHSFWVPAYAGKLDMIPGRTNTLHIKAKHPGLARGQCAEYCGGAHALMSFFVEALPEDEFEQWIEKEKSPALRNNEAGARLFHAVGCGGCHTVRGTSAKGVIGPDLTHVASRHSLAAAALDNDEAAFQRWLRMHQKIKPDNRMPGFDFLSDEEIAELASYLGGLE
ncbi:MAG: cytochrome c oxidase subunit II [Parvularcula sp.]|nr:cytochrome c oxidase subunit II [Parvularcula sp.]